MAEIACLGLLVADIVGRPIDALPKRGTLELVERIELHTGGCAANTAVTLAKIGVSTAILGKVGQDGFGDYLAAAMAAHGLETRGLRRDPDAATAATMVVVHSDAERSFLHVIGANATFTAADVDWEVAGMARILHVAGLQLMTAFEGDGVAQTLREAKRRGLVTTLDTVMNPRSRAWDGLAPALPYLDWALPSYEEAVTLTGEAEPERIAAKLMAAGAKNVVIKMGSEGCFVATADAQRLRVPPLAVTAVDSLGAGDAWAGGFLTGLLHGWSVERTARFANAVGACCVQSLGATTGILPLAETLAMAEAAYPA